MKTIAQHLNVKDFPFEIFDKNGNRIYFENSDRFWEKREYDSKGNLIYFADSKGYRSEREYDSNGNEIHFENSSGYWIKREFDKNGNEIYYENSTGLIEDNRKVLECTMDKLVKKTSNFKIKNNHGKESRKD